MREFIFDDVDTNRGNMFNKARFRKTNYFNGIAYNVSDRQTYIIQAELHHGRLKRILKNTFPKVPITKISIVPFNYSLTETKINTNSIYGLQPDYLTYTRMLNKIMDMSMNDIAFLKFVMLADSDVIDFDTIEEFTGIDRYYNDFNTYKNPYIHEENQDERMSKYLRLKGRQNGFI